MSIFLRRGIVLSLSAIPALAPAIVFAQATDVAVAEDRIKVGAVNVYGFQPPEAEGDAFDVANLNLRLVFDEMGTQAAEWYQHVMTLSNPFFEGRAPGLEGNRHAADYIEFFFREYGLEPAFPSGEEEPGGAVRNGAWTSYRQPFSARSRDTDNVGGVLRGRGSLADEWVVIGAHYDHVGYGNMRSLDREGGVLHPGADDNASGTSGMLMLAKRFAEEYRHANEENLRSILFMGFSAEEMGLIGSRHYVRNSTLDADQINIMINLDMIGRLRDDSLMIGGVGSAEGLLDTIKPHLLESGLTIFADPNGRGPSDHSNFYGAGIPVLFMFTGTHSVYHQPGDFGYTVNPVGAARIINMTYDIAHDMVTQPQTLAFTEVEMQQPAEAGRGGGRSRVSLGIMPRYDAALETGVLIAQVFEGGSAEAAGLLKDDIILKWNGEDVSGGATLMRNLRSSEPGDIVTLTIRRGSEDMEVKVELKERGE